MKIVASLLALIVQLPIWYFLLYSVLVRVNATELMWFLYWIYLPVGVVSSVVLKVSEAK